MKGIKRVVVGSAVGGLLLTGCAPNSDLVAIKCNENMQTLIGSTLTGSEPTIEENKYENVKNYLIDYKTKQVKRWLDKENAPLVTMEGTRFGPDFITWNLYTGSGFELDIKKDLVSLNRETLIIEGEKKGESTSQSGTIISSIGFTGTCKKTDIPWDKIKSKQI